MNADHPQPLDFSQVTIGLIDSVVVLATALVRVGLVTRQQLAATF